MNKLTIDNLNQTIEVWINELDRINFIQLCTKPSPTSWSLGQVYVHLIESTNYYLEQVTICLASDDYAREAMTADANEMFYSNEFPDVVIEGPVSNEATLQPESKVELKRCLMNLKEDINTVALLISTSQFNGKTKHPGLNYFSADEWLRFAEMHFRHHLRQKKRIEKFLEITS